jgi:hypothetical protein
MVNIGGFQMKQICGVLRAEYFMEGIQQLEALRDKIEEKLGEIEFMLKDFGNNVPELRGMVDRAKAYWLPSIQGMLRDRGSMVNFDDSIREISRELTEGESDGEE